MTQAEISNARAGALIESTEERLERVRKLMSRLDSVVEELREEIARLNPEESP